jgi:hypothetical protein
VLLQSLADIIVDSRTCAKVNHFNNFGLGVFEKDVFRLDVSVNQVVGMEVLQNHYKLVD